MMSKILMSLLLTSTSVFAADFLTEVEVPIENTFVPHRGYDDNDNIQIVVHGLLPNSCYQIGKTTVEQKNGRYTIKQFATKDEGSFCSQEGNLPPHLQQMVPFTNEIELGALKEGTYNIDFKTMNSEINSRSFQVSQASVQTVDSLRYAAVSNAVIPEVIYDTNNVTVNLMGVFTNTCTTFDQIQILKQDDVYVVLPTVKVRNDVQCIQMMIPFEKKISLGEITKGEFLVHVRSQSGRSVNRIFEVIR